MRQANIRADLGRREKAGALVENIERHMSTHHVLPPPNKRVLFSKCWRHAWDAAVLVVGGGGVLVDTVCSAQRPACVQMRVDYGHDFPTRI